jgi:ABC-2 type transport system permease protein
VTGWETRRTGPSAALSFLASRTVRNRLRAQARRLRSPRYLLAVAVAILYLVFLIYRPGGQSGGVGTVLPRSAGPGSLRAVTALTAFGFALLVAKWWLVGSSNSALAFSNAELQFLFPAPMSRRQLVLYKVWRLQIGLLASAFFIAVIVHGAGAGLPSPLRMVSLWVFFSVLSLHQMAAGLVREGAMQRGRGLRRNAVPILIAGAAVLILMVTALRAWPGARSIGEVPSALLRVGTALGAPLPAVVLWPFRTVLAASYAATPRAWLAALWPALILMALHIVWVLRADAVFEDAAVEASARRAVRIASRHARGAGAAYPTPSVVGVVGGSLAKVSGSFAAISGTRPRFVANTPARTRRFVLPLGPLGDPSVAVLWKNTLALARGTRFRTIFVTVIALGVIISIFWQAGLLGDADIHNGTALLATLAITATGFLVIMGPLTVRNDLRQDLLHLDVLRTLPLTGTSLVFAEIASSALALTFGQWLLLIGAYALLAWNGSPPAGVADPPSHYLFTVTRDAEFLIGFVALPFINCASLFVQNTAALLFPAWIRLGGTGTGGLEVFGQRILTVGASLLGLAVLLTPPTFAAFAVLIPMTGPDGPPPASAVVAGLIAAVVVAVAELSAGIHWLGRWFETTDPSAILPQP